MSDYSQFLMGKRLVAPSAVLDVLPDTIHPALYDFQRDLCRWALRKGRSALWADTGLGKTVTQLEWCRHVGGRVLIVAPLCVSEQTIREAQDKLDLAVRFVRHGREIRDGIQITNYEMLRHFVGVQLDGLCLDESSIRASLDGVTRTMLLKQFTDVPYKLACTATPCPNDIAELANHAEFLGIMRREDMLASFFVHDDAGWRLRGHARTPFFRWLASWAMSLKNPADLGYDGSRFALPPLTIRDVVVETEWRKPGELFAGKLKGITDRVDVRRQTISTRVQAAVEVIEQSWHTNQRKQNASTTSNIVRPIMSELRLSSGHDTMRTESASLNVTERIEGPIQRRPMPETGHTGEPIKP